MTKCIIYRANIKYGGEVKFYLGSTENHWKSCFDHHQMTLGNIKYSNSTAFCKLFWKIKSSNRNPTIIWNYVTKLKPLSRKDDKYSLWLSEKLMILKNIDDLNVKQKE